MSPTAEREWLAGLREAAGMPPAEPWLLAAIDERLADLAEAAEPPVEPPTGAGTPARQVPGGSDAPGGHWCTVADDVAARLQAAEDELARHRRFAEQVAALLNQKGVTR